MESEMDEQKQLTPQQQEEECAWWYGAAYQWNWSKVPANPEARQEWAEDLREMRADAFAEQGEARTMLLTGIRRIHRETRPKLITAEARVRELAQRIRHDYELWRAERQGGLL